MSGNTRAAAAASKARMATKGAIPPPPMRPSKQALRWLKTYKKGIQNDDLDPEFKRTNNAHEFMWTGIVYHCREFDCNYKKLGLAGPCNAIGLITGVILPGTVCGDDKEPQKEHLFEARCVDGNPCKQINNFELELCDFRPDGKNPPVAERISLDQVMACDYVNDHSYGRSISLNKSKGYGCSYQPTNLDVTDGCDDNNDDEDHSTTTPSDRGGPGQRKNKEKGASIHIHVMLLSCIN